MLADVAEINLDAGEIDIHSVRRAMSSPKHNSVGEAVSERERSRVPADLRLCSDCYVDARARSPPRTPTMKDASGRADKGILFSRVDS